MSQTVSFKLLNVPGLKTAPARESSLRASAEALELEPYALIVHNESEETIIAYALRTTLVDANGITSIKERIFTNLNTLPGGGVVPNGMEIAPRTSRVIAASVSLPLNNPAPNLSGQAYSTGAAARNVATEYAQQNSIVVSLDLVVYETGRVIGPDDGELIHNIQAQINVERELALLIRQQFEAGKSLQDIAGLLTEKSQTSVRERGSGMAAINHWEDFFTGHVSRFYLYKLRSSPEALTATVEMVLARPVLALRR